MLLEQFKKLAKKIPDTPGVYFFLGKRKEVLYIGKATSLRSRLRSYFSPDLIESRSQLIVSMIEKASSIDWRETDSVLEALLLEGALIRTYKPKANTDAKDDKSYNNVVITKEDFPQVLLVRNKNLGDTKQYKYVFGPFPHGLQLKEAMKIIRKIFPYRDEKCHPGQAVRSRGPQARRGRPCFNRQLGLCPGVCTGEISKEEYARTIRHIALLFEGKKKVLIQSLEKEMKAAAKVEEFELAKEYRRQIFALQHIQDVSLIKEEYRTPTAMHGERIEAYDVAHLRGSSNVGVMTVVENGEANKNEYRKFIIRTAKPGDDAGALREILSRRLGHDEWPMPRLIAVDGSTVQMNAARRVLEEYGIKIPIVGVTKDEKHRPRAIQGDKKLLAGREKDILLANTEAHRFAITYHRKKSRKNLTI
ncbi:MAG TPA: UvrB/UvrC motif-containing protein [Candidatus Paceibacterota bacterium]